MLCVLPTQETNGLALRVRTVYVFLFLSVGRHGLEQGPVAIARDFLLPRQRERAALTDDEVTVTEAALRKIAADYTREPGVRQFERLLAKALRKATTKLEERRAQSDVAAPPVPACPSRGMGRGNRRPRLVTVRRLESRPVGRR